MWCKAPRGGLDRRYTNFNDYYYHYWYDFFSFSHVSKNHFHNKGFALSLVLKARDFLTRKWPIRIKLGVIGAYKSAFDMFVRRTGSSWGGRVDGYCNRLRPVSIWSLRSLWSQRSLRKKSSAIIWKPLSCDRSDNDRWDRTFYFGSDCCRCDRWRVVSYDSYDRCDR